MDKLKGWGLKEGYSPPLRNFFAHLKRLRCKMVQHFPSFSAYKRPFFLDSMITVCWNFWEHMPAEQGDQAKEEGFLAQKWLFLGYGPDIKKAQLPSGIWSYIEGSVSSVPFQLDLQSSLNSQVLVVNQRKVTKCEFLYLHSQQYWSDEAIVPLKGNIRLH